MVGRENFGYDLYVGDTKQDCDDQETMQDRASSSLWISSPPYAHNAKASTMEQEQRTEAACHQQDEQSQTDRWLGLLYFLLAGR